ncbi:SURF5-domain-containing protein [Basidiobolus meristosporus CBS 931.73]|uniref:SURF5-domain-containing protein n=1 Tax=Basidiobolus meristosporus CBS 931.73 TaxID=1314790 RepID=A0A1Y1YMX2_9FUNG|nr:SURF5-domain-containing protein [Basidiobolus meristosporus CBS 931.73]|eukprot:ORX98914.1 SURF5-domain-containing protein [Basidiobolus meristosporus CBS 931.73]
MATTSNKPAPTGNVSTNALTQIEETYNKRLDNELDQLVDSFGDIIRVAKIQDKDKFRIAQENYQVECRAANIVRSVESLLGLVTELKQSLLLNDTNTLNHFTTSRIRVVSNQKEVVKDSVVKLRGNLDSAIWEMENAYYNSRYIS